MAFQINTTSWADNSRNLTNIAGTDSATMTALTLELVSENSLATGTTIRAARAGAIAGAGIVEGLRVDFIQRGTVNFYVEIANSFGFTTTFTLARYRAGVASVVWTQTTTSVAYVAYNSDQAVLPGDVFIFRVQGSASAMQNTRIRTSATSAWIPTGRDSWYHNY